MSNPQSVKASFSDNIVKITEEFQVSTLAKEENNCLGNVVGRIVAMNVQEDVKVVEVNPLQKVSEEKEEELKARVKELSSLPVDCSTLESILANVAAADNTTSSAGEPNFLSFNKQNTNSLPRFSNVVDPKAFALSNDIHNTKDQQRCRSCFNVIINACNFCPFCGNILRPNYRRL